MDGDCSCGVFSCGSEIQPGGLLLPPGDDKEVCIAAKPEWEEDTARSVCARCAAKFGLLRRRHHCEDVGLYCAEDAARGSLSPNSSVTATSLSGCASGA